MTASKDFWGPSIWTSIHILALGVTRESVQYYEEFLWVLTRLLPCDYCRANLAAKLREYDPEQYLTNGEPQIAFFYSYVIHDLANQHITEHTKTEKISPPFHDVLQEYVTRYNDDSFWGPPIWSMIHILAATFRSSDAAYYKKFLELLAQILPNYRSTLKEFIRDYPIDPYLVNNENLFHYTYVLHNYVNRERSVSSPAYIPIKTFYFSSLGESCRDCN